MKKKECLTHSIVRNISKSDLRFMAIKDYHKIINHEVCRPKWCFTDKQLDKFASELDLTREEFKIYYAYFVAACKGGRIPEYI